MCRHYSGIFGARLGRLIGGDVRSVLVSSFMIDLEWTLDVLPALLAAARRGGLVMCNAAAQTREGVLNPQKSNRNPAPSSLLRACRQGLYVWGGRPCCILSVKCIDLAACMSLMHIGWHKFHLYLFVAGAVRRGDGMRHLLTRKGARNFVVHRAHLPDRLGVHHSKVVPA